MPCGSLIQPARFPRLFSSVPPASVRREAMWVRSGPIWPSAGVPSMVWQAAQVESRNTPIPARVDAVVACAAGLRCARRQLSNSPGSSARTRRVIRACWSPQNSAHSPRKKPGRSAVISTDETLPGVMSTLRVSSGTQNEWMTSLVRSRMVTVSPTGIAISFAVLSPWSS